MGVRGCINWAGRQNRIWQSAPVSNSFSTIFGVILNQFDQRYGGFQFGFGESDGWLNGFVDGRVKFEGKWAMIACLAAYVMRSSTNKCNGF